MNFAIINSLLQTDLYIFSMMDFIFTNAPNAVVKYRFICRNKGIKLGFLLKQVQEQVDEIAKLKFTADELAWMSKLRYMHTKYLEFLVDFNLKASDVHVSCNANGDLEIEIEGRWLDVIMWEVPLLATVNELYFNSLVNEKEQDYAGFGMKFSNGNIGDANLNRDIAMMKAHPQFKLSEFGTRRRFSAQWQDHVICRLQAETVNLVGTSNMYYAKKYNLTPIGTMAHCLISGYLGMVDNIEIAQRTVLYQWLAHFDTMNGPDLGIALTDTFGTDAFLRDFKYTLANAYNGVRHDSGCPYKFGEKVIDHYKSMKIDPRTKTIIFSDGLTVEKAINLFETFVGKISVGFGIGTSLTNNCGFDPLNIVIKLVKCNGVECVKLSDNVTKAIGDSKMIERVKAAYGVK